MKHENVVLFDNAGLPSIMVKFTPEAGKPLDPVFMVCGRRAKAIYISKYENTIVKGVPCSIPFAQAANCIDFDEASALCRGKGEGWHLMTNAEWEYLHKESLAGGTMPHGNTASGSYFFDKSESGEKYDYGHTLTGSGPVTWTHTHTPDGVCDLCGDNWEMTAGLRLVKGAIEYIKDNDAAVADLSTDSKAWQRAKTAAGQDIFLDASKGGVTVTTEAPEEDCWDGCRFKGMEINLEEVPDILRQLGIVPENVKEETAYIYADTGEEEAVPFRGSGFHHTSHGGFGALRLYYPRSFVYGIVGFRSAYVEFEELETEN
ncbi:MAG: SUMF1/EgtB/PvdO family nonheme iron enzyme [Muribaculum sp.]|nr:SUMF1/EgtB/PvdO family nonheme iron enzyme [Muribaculum sp.]